MNSNLLDYKSQQNERKDTASPGAVIEESTEDEKVSRKSSKKIKAQDLFLNAD